MSDCTSISTAKLISSMLRFEFVCVGALNMYNAKCLLFVQLTVLDPKRFANWFFTSAPSVDGEPSQNT